MSNEQAALWYVIHTYSGYENKVAANIERMVETRGLENLIFETRIPTEILVDSEEEADEYRKGDDYVDEDDVSEADKGDDYTDDETSPKSVRPESRRNTSCSELCSRENDHERRNVAYCPQYPRCDRLCRTRKQAGSADRKGSGGARRRGSCP